MTENAALEQGSPAWINARLGKITASRFKDVMGTPKAAHKYMMDLVAETLTGQSQGHRTTAAEQHGHDHEPAARALYEKRMGCEVLQVGFIEHPLDPMIGGSPDGLVGRWGGVEIKCPYNSAIHLGYILGGVVPKEHLAQVNGHLWLSGREWWDFVSYDRRMDNLKLALWRLRVYRRSEMMVHIDDVVFAFRDRLLETLAKLIDRRNET